MDQARANLDLIKQAYDWWNKNKEVSFENWMNLIADDVRWC